MLPGDPPPQGSVEIRPSQCWECSTYCPARVHVRDGRVVKVTGDPDNPYSRGAFCVKGARGSIATTYHPDRLLHPLRRDGERGQGRWRRIAWDEALDEIADRFGEVARRHGPLALSGAVSSAFFSRGVAMALLFRCLGSPNVMINQDLCQGARSVSDMVTGLGAPMGEEIEAARCILVVGRSPRDSNVVQWRQIRHARRQGCARLVVIDPRPTELARMADLWLRVRPGADRSLALAMTRVVIEEELYDKTFVDRWCSGFDALRLQLAGLDESALSARCGVPAEAIRQAARLYAGARPATLSLGHGIDSQVGGLQTARAYHNLIALTGNLDVPGGNRRAKRLPGFWDGWDFVRRPEFQLPREVQSQAIGAARFPLWCGPDGWARAPHNPSVVEAMLTGEPYPVRALFASGVNLVVTYPGTERTLAALGSLDFLVASGHALNPTLDLADLVLPKTTALEEEEVHYIPGGPIVQLTQRVVEPRGEARSDLDVVADLIPRLRERGLVRHELFPWNGQREFNQFLLAGTGVVLDDLRPTGFHAIPYRYRDFETSGFATPSGKVELYASRLEAIGQDPLPPPCDPEPQAPPDHPLRLLTGMRSLVYHHSRFRDQDWARRLEPAAQLAVHPQTAARMGLAEGDDVWLETAVSEGRCRLTVHIEDTGSPDVVATGMGWWLPEFGGSGAALAPNVNWVVPYGPPWDPVLGCPDTRGLACRLIPVGVAPVP